MNLELFRSYCLQKKGVTESFPFDENTLVFKVMNKMFALTDINTFESVNLKATSENIILLQESYNCVQPGYHMNKKHWITVCIDQSIPDGLLFEWLDNSYNLIVSSFSKKQKEEFISC